jgi:phospholipase D1/2
MGVTRRVRRDFPADPIVQPGKNCWRVERAHQFYCVQDGADYFRLVREALLCARRTVFILGWDIFAGVDLLPAASPNVVSPKAKAEAPALREPTRLDDLLAFIARRQPRLHCYILIWDYAALYTLERDPWSRWRLGWRTHRRVHFGFDDRHPVGGSHHQKVIVVDDQLAFCGGIDLTSHRWDTSAHRLDEPARTTTMGKPYGPYHEIQAMVSGPVAASLGELARDRWRALDDQRMPPVRISTDDHWPRDVTPDLTDVDVAIARTVPGSDAQPPVRECEALFLDSIARAERSIYIESQYFTNDALAAALAARLKEPHGPEVVIVSPDQCHGWLEKSTMGAFRHEVFRTLIDADAHNRLRLVYPAASRAQHVPTFVHSKVMVVDDVLVRIGSANFSRRSMGLDTECDLAMEARDAEDRAGIRRIRDRLLAEHLGLTPENFARRLERTRSIRALIDSRADADRTLVRIELPPEPETSASETLRAVADPEEPIAFGSAVAELVPPVDATNGLRPMRVPTVPAMVVALVVAAITLAALWRQELQASQQTLETVPGLPSMMWIGVGAFVVANLVLVPLELLTIAAGVLLGARQGAVVALLGSLAAAALAYAVGRAFGLARLAPWISRRSYRSVSQLGARGVIGVLVLRLASVASAGSIHLLCGAGRVPFAAFLAGTAIGLIPAVAALTGLGALVRHTVLHPSLTNALMTVGAALALTACAVTLRTFLLIRQFAPSISGHRARAEFG